jgi:hypothetical protein
MFEAMQRVFVQIYTGLEAGGDLAPPAKLRSAESSGVDWQADAFVRALEDLDADASNAPVVQRLDRIVRAIEQLGERNLLLDVPPLDLDSSTGLLTPTLEQSASLDT